MFVSPYLLPYLLINVSVPLFITDMSLEDMATRVDNGQILFAKNTQSINAKDSQAHWLVGLAGDDTLKNKNISTLATNDTLASKQNLADNRPYYLEVA
jgi:hypothetical protein